jgi:DNA-binding transcriptional LysR family regulator
MYEKLLTRRGLSFERLRALLELAEAGSLVRAAQGDPIRQSQYSRQISELENYFEVELTQRTGNRLTLTEAGLRLVQIAREAFLGLNDFETSSREMPTTVTVGGGASLLQWLVLPRLGKMQRLLSKTRFHLLDLRTADIIQGLNESRVDFGLVREPAVASPLKCQRLFKLDYSLFVPKAMLPKSKATDYRQLLETLPLAMLSSGGQFDQSVEAVLRKLNCQAALNCSSHTLACRAVLSGDYASILPSIAAVDLDANNFAQVSLPLIKPSERMICLAWNPRLIKMRPRLEKVVILAGKHLK